MLEIIPIPAFQDNYMWLGINRELNCAFVVDPGEAQPVLDYLKKEGLTLSAILVTHKHPDHTDGISALAETFPEIPVYAHPTEKVATMTHPVRQGESVKLEMWPDAFKVMHIPGHTLGHVAFYTPTMLFSGDTLFGAGCGRVFEGTAAQMLSSLNQLADLPDTTLVYCGHEYTLANLEFAALIEPENVDIQERIEQTKTLRAANTPSLPSTIALEKKTNPFLRCTKKGVIMRVEDYVNRRAANPVDVFHELREWKNNL